jgi:hypothetical protein
MTLYANVAMPDQEDLSLAGDSVEDLAEQLAYYEDEDLYAVVYNEAGFIRGWIYGDGNWVAR